MEEIKLIKVFKALNKQRITMRTKNNSSKKRMFREQVTERKRKPAG